MPDAFFKLMRVLQAAKHPHRLDALRGLVESGDGRVKNVLFEISEKDQDPQLVEEARRVLASWKEK
jgi:hypothetical protein